jgi:hypothetical protein
MALSFLGWDQCGEPVVEYDRNIAVFSRASVVAVGPLGAMQPVAAGRRAGVSLLAAKVTAFLHARPPIPSPGTPSFLCVAMHCRHLS